MTDAVRSRDSSYEPRNFLQPCLLLLLLERPDHGYSLLDRLKAFGVSDDNPGRVYRALRELERAGATRSSWRASPTGPARRVYSLTPAGQKSLEGCTLALDTTYRTIGEYLARHARITARAEASPRGVPHRPPQRRPGQEHVHSV